MIDVTQIIRSKRDTKLLDKLETIMEDHGILSLHISYNMDGGITIHGDSRGTRALGYSKDKRDIRTAIDNITIQHGIGD